MSVHTTSQRLFNIFIKRICTHRNDWKCFAVITWKLSNFSGCLQSIHDWHHNVHKNKIIFSFLALTYFFQSLLPIICFLDLGFVLIQNGMDNLHIQFIIFHDQNMLFFQIQ